MKCDKCNIGTLEVRSHNTYICDNEDCKQLYNIDGEMLDENELEFIDSQQE